MIVHGLIQLLDNLVFKSHVYEDFLLTRNVIIFIRQKVHLPCGSNNRQREVTVLVLKPGIASWPNHLLLTQSHMVVSTPAIVVQVRQQSSGGVVVATATFAKPVGQELSEGILAAMSFVGMGGPRSVTFENLSAWTACKLMGLRVLIELGRHWRHLQSNFREAIIEVRMP